MVTEGIKNRLLLLLFLLVLYLLYSHGNQQKERRRLQSNQAILQDSLRYVLLENGQQVARREVLEVRTAALQQQLWIRDDSLRLLQASFDKVRAAIVHRTRLQIDTVFVPFDSVVPCTYRRSFFLQNRQYQLSGWASEQGVSVAQLSVYNTQRLVLGEQRSFWKHRLYVDISHSNPLVQSTEIQAQVVTVPIRRFGLSVFAGCATDLQPSIGLGLSYTFLFF